MNEGYLEPGVYAIHKRAGLGSFFIIPEKIIVHNEAFAVIYQVKPKTELKVIDIRKDRKKIDSILYRCAGSSVFMGLGKLPSPPLDLCLGRVQTCR